jgi:hypothetical protein
VEIKKRKNKINEIETSFFLGRKINKTEKPLFRMTKEKNNFKNRQLTGHQWLTPIILATQEAEIRRIKV